MRFLLTCLWVWLMILRLPPTHYHDPSMTTITGESPDTVRFAHHALLDSYGVVVVDWKRMNALKLKTLGVYRVHPRMLYRVHRPAAVIVTLLLASGDIESNPGPVQYPCTVCEKPVKRNQREKGVGMGLCQYVDPCFYALSLPCSHTFWHAIPTSFYIFNVFKSCT